MKKKDILIVLMWMSPLVLAVWVYGHLEVYCVFYPAIDTEFAPGFSEQAFEQIKVGMTVNEVKEILGEPLGIYSEKDGQVEWGFTNDGKCWWGDFAWLNRSITFSNETVISIDKRIYYD